MSSNLPPGVTESMIPGNRPEDAAWDAVWEDITGEAIDANLSADDVRRVWDLGIKALHKEYTKGDDQ